MKPPLSVIFFTLFSGSGLGLCAWIILLSLNPIYLPGIQAQATLLLSTSALLTTAGLICVFFHLANPKNVWRTLAQLKTSWLSREILCSSLFYPFLICYALSLKNIYLNQADLVWFAIPLLSSIFATVLCTGMMYRCLKTIPQWHTNWVILNYFTLAAASGSLILWFIAQWQVPFLINISSQIGILCFSIALLSKAIYFNYLNKLKKNKSSLQTATGIKHRLTHAVNNGHSSPNFIDKEFSFTKSKNFISRLIFLTIIFAFIFPLATINLTFTNILSLILIMIVTSYGLFIERWLFFAQAYHVVNLYN